MFVEDKEVYFKYRSLGHDCNDGFENGEKTFEKQTAGNHASFASRKAASHPGPVTFLITQENTIIT